MSVRLRRTPLTRCSRPSCPALSCSTHVEILGNELMLADLLRIAAGQHQGIQDSIITKIEDIAAKIPWDEL